MAKCTFTKELLNERKQDFINTFKHIHMKSINIPVLHKIFHYNNDKTILSECREYIHKNEELWEYNKLAIGAVGVFFQVTIAAAMIATLGMAHGNLWIAGIGILFAFMANSIVFMQGRVLWMILSIICSMLVNASIAIYYVLSLNGYSLGM